MMIMEEWFTKENGILAKEVEVLEKEKKILSKRLNIAQGAYRAAANEWERVNLEVETLRRLVQEIFNHYPVVRAQYEAPLQGTRELLDQYHEIEMEVSETESEYVPDSDLTE